jgi:hypothetical protein
MMKEPLSITHPDIAAQWHPLKNGDLTPDRVVAGSNRRIWWHCPKGLDHEWEVTVAKRSTRGDGCPFCRGLRVSLTNSLAARFPAIAAEWHPTKNGSLTPDQIVAGSGKMAWWQCPKSPDHEWQARLDPRTRAGVGCPFCAGRRASGTNSLIAHFPEVAAEWHRTKNGSLTSDQVVPESNRKVWWQCPKSPDHQWQTTIASRTGGSGCPSCSNSLGALFPDVAAQWHRTKNGELTSDQIVPGSNRKVWWQCPKGPDHEWLTAVYHRAIQGSGCPCCAGQKVSVTNSLAARFPDLAGEWHPTKNRPLTPDQVVARSDKSVWWQCFKSPDHVWQAKIYNRTQLGSGCLACAGLKASVTNSLATRFPAIAAEWHPTKNGSLTPDQVVAGSEKKVWWQCPKSPDHQWQATPYNRSRQALGCPFCAGRQASSTNSLAALFPEVAADWHPTKNGSISPTAVAARSRMEVWWRCPKGPDHEWQAGIQRRMTGQGCPACAGRQLSITNSLATRFPAIAAEWHRTKNGSLTPNQVVAGSGKKAWWQCPKSPDHQWQASLDQRTRAGVGCPFCAGKMTSGTNSLIALFPGVAAEWHPTKNGSLTPDQVVAGSEKKVWWQCPKSPDHQWQATPYGRSRLGTSCPYCSGREVSSSNSLASLFPELAAQWHPTRNGDLAPDQVTRGTQRKVWWRCPNGPDHEWQASVASRTRLRAGCPACAGLKASVTNSLATRFPAIAAEWHRTKNGSLTPNQVVAGSGKKAWWQCPKSPDHQWQATLDKRVTGAQGCPYCNRGWTLEAIRVFVGSLKDHLQTFTPAELYLLFQQNGLLKSSGKGRAFVKALTTGRFPGEEVEKFVKGEPSLVDSFIEDSTQTLEDTSTHGETSTPQPVPAEGYHHLAEDSHGTVDDVLDRADDLIEDMPAEAEASLPLVQTNDVLTALDLHVITSADEEAVEFLVASATAKIWKHAFQDELAAVAQAEAFKGGSYAERVKSGFLDEYRRAKGLDIPDGYAFRVNGVLAPPNLMQRVATIRVRDGKQVGNWSGTGAGKTLSAVLASRVIGSRLTVICCPNSVVEGWQRAILEAFPNSLVATKTFSPNWAVVAGDATGLGVKMELTTPRYLILNYEAFQQPDSHLRVRSLGEREPIDFIVVDEIHYAKQRVFENLSQRRQLVAALRVLAAERNPDLHVLGMSATPVINNLQEGKSMVELVTGVAHDELETTPTVPSCMKLHQRLMMLGIRWMPEYDLSDEQFEIDVDCSEFLDEIRMLGRRCGSPLALEQILTRARLPVIRDHIAPKTLIYTHYVSGIDRLLRDALVADGWKVGFYTGEDKSGLDGFLDRDIDVLIGSSAIGTGVDGLQQVCNRLIVNVLPWTAAEFEQLKGRIYRQGQRQDKVTVVLPLTYAEVNGQRWSWCESKMHRLRFKKSIADAAVDGVVPEGHLRTPAQAYQDIIAWLERLETGAVTVITRPRIVVPLPADDPTEVEQRQRRYGDFSHLNQAWNRSRSEVTHERLQANPEEWEQYHTLYREARKDWAVVPYEEVIRWCRQRSGYVIGDFGCGEAKLADQLSDRHTVHSFDHVAINDKVVACDMAHAPLDDETLDVAVFSLSLMGSNFGDYLREAHRTLKLDGHLHIIEATERFSGREQFAEGLKALGFDVVSVEDKWKFTHIRALKSERPPRAGGHFQF